MAQWGLAPLRPAPCAHGDRHGVTLSDVQNQEKKSYIQILIIEFNFFPKG